MSRTTLVSVALFIATILLIGSGIYSAAQDVAETMAQPTDLIELLAQFN